MSPQLMATILFKLIDLGIRYADRPEDVEEYIKLRTQLRNELVAQANEPAGDDPDHGYVANGNDAPASVEGDPHPREEGDEAEADQNQS